MNGIVIIATGNRFYGELAYNLALSIKCKSVIDISIIGFGEAFKTAKNKNHTINTNNCTCLIFDNFIEVEEQPIGLLKLKLYELSPYDKTIYLDADTVFLEKRITWLFEDLKYSTFEFQNLPIATRYYKERSVMHWATESNIKKAFNITELAYTVNSFIMYFETDKSIELIFKKAQDIYNTLKSGNKVLQHVSWGGDVPDELCLTIACNLCNYTPNNLYWQPFAVPGVDFTNADQIYVKYWGLTLPSTAVNPMITTFYIDTIKMLYQQNNITTDFLYRKKTYFDKTPVRNIHLIMQYFTSRHAERNGEFLFCLQKNLVNPYIEKIHLFLEVGSIVPIESDKIVIIPLEKRATYEIFINYANTELIGNVILIANTDIYFDSTLDYIRDYKLLDKFFFCLSKWNIDFEAVPELSPDCITSQDAWMFLSPSKPFNTDIELGQPGCDCRIAYEAEMSGYITNNPAYLIHCYHFYYHLNYLKYNFHHSHQIFHFHYHLHIIHNH